MTSQTPRVLNKNLALHTLQEAITTVRKTCRSEFYDGIEFGMPLPDKRICIDINQLSGDKLGLNDIVCKELGRIVRKPKDKIALSSGNIEFDFNGKDHRKITFDIDTASVPMSFFDDITATVHPGLEVENNTFVTQPISIAAGRPESKAPYNPKHLVSASLEDRNQISALVRDFSTNVTRKIQMFEKAYTLTMRDLISEAESKLDELNEAHQSIVEATCYTKSMQSKSQDSVRVDSARSLIRDIKTNGAGTQNERQFIETICIALADVNASRTQTCERLGIGRRLCDIASLFASTGN